MLSNYLSDRAYLLLTIAIATLFAFWKLGDASLMSWDEAYYGITALEMMMQNDYVNNYFLGQPDAMNVKPPLMYWLICLSYKLFGFNEFALRLPSAIAAIGFFFVVFKLVNLYRPGWFAFFVCLMLISGKGIFGPHVARTGDTDMLLTLWMTLFVYAFLRFVYRSENKFAIIGCIAIALAFWTKSTASFFFLPGMFIFLLLTKKLIPLLKNPYTYIAISIFMSSILLWVLMFEMYGNTFEDSIYGGSNAWQTTFIYDTFKRFFNTEFQHGSSNKWSFVFVYLDSKFIGWNFVFYAVTLVGLIWLFKTKTTLKQLILKNSNQLMVLSVLIVITVSLVLTISNHKHGWYLAPVHLFFCIITIEGIYKLSNKFKPIVPLTLVALLITSTINFIDINKPETGIKDFFNAHAQQIKKADKIYFFQRLEPKYILYSQWLNLNFEVIDDIPQNSNGIIITTNSDDIKLIDYKPIACYKSVCLYNTIKAN